MQISINFKYLTCPYKFCKNIINYVTKNNNFYVIIKNIINEKLQID